MSFVLGIREGKVSLGRLSFDLWTWGLNVPGRCFWALQVHGAAGGGSWSPAEGKVRNWKAQCFSLSSSDQYYQIIHRLFNHLLDLLTTSRGYIWRTRYFSGSMMIEGHLSEGKLENIRVCPLGAEKGEFGVFDLWHTQRSHVPRGPELNSAPEGT